MAFLNRALEEPGTRGAGETARGVEVVERGDGPRSAGRTP
jgi:hypothetical protein